MFRTKTRIGGLLLAATGGAALMAAAAFAQPAGMPPGVLPPTDGGPNAIAGTTVTDGTASWGLSTYLNSANFGRPNPLPSAYVAPATFDEATRITTWGNGTGVVRVDGSASLAFDGVSVNFAGTGGGWLRLADLEVEIDGRGNGVVTARVSYGTSTDGTPPAVSFMPLQAPHFGPTRLPIVTLEGNDAAPTLSGGTASWAALAGTWTEEFMAALQVAEWSYAATVTNTAAGREPLPFSFTVTLAD